METLGQQMHHLESEARMSVGGERLYPQLSGESAIGSSMLSPDSSSLSQDSASVGDVIMKSKLPHDSPGRSHDFPGGSHDFPERSHGFPGKLPDSDGRLQNAAEEAMKLEEPDGREGSDDEDKFFDAQEISANEEQTTVGAVSLDTSTLEPPASFSLMHKRNESMVSMNESQSRRSPPTASDQLPVGRERTMSVSLPVVP